MEKHHEVIIDSRRINNNDNKNSMSIISALSHVTTEGVFIFSLHIYQDLACPRNERINSHIKSVHLDLISKQKQHVILTLKRMYKFICEYMSDLYLNFRNC